MELFKTFTTPRTIFPLNFHRHVKCLISLSSSTAPNSTHRVELAESLQAETLQTLEWPSVCNQLSAFTSTTMGFSAARTARVPLGSSPDESRKLLAQTTAAVAVPQPLDFSGIQDVTDILDSAVNGQLLSIIEICAVKKTLESSRALLEQLKDISLNCDDFKRYSPLLEILEDCNFLTELEQKIEFCIDCKFSTILDRASEDLEIIRSERKENMEKLESLLKEVAVKIFQAGGNDRPLVTRRRSRMCVGIRVTRRFLLPDGVVLNTSSSGATYFMEPKEALELNNMEVKLSDAESVEEQAVLSFLTSEIAESITEIKYLLDRVLEVDFAFARAAHARWMNGTCPMMNLDGSKDSKSNVIESLSIDIEVPIDVKVKSGTRVVVISGPNAGGKTASMKTLGLASVMLKAGMFIPASNQPTLPWFDLILANIGDHQSLEHSLSTFSGHLSWICKILEVASQESLVLMDEIGSGTDPSEGVALSTSILQYLKDRVNLAVVTTHYADLSRLKEKDTRFENAAMEFSLETLQPTYRVLWGSTGESNALSIATSIGFDKNIIERAQTWVERLMPEKAEKRRRFLFEPLMEEKNRLEEQANRAASVYSDTMNIYHEILDAADDLDRREAAIKAKETQQIQKELIAAKSQIETVVKEFENQLQIASADQLNSLLKESESAIASIVDRHRHCHHPTDDFSVREANSSSYTPKLGDQVLVNGLGNRLVTIIDMPGADDDVLVQYGKIRVRVNKSRIRARPNTKTSRKKGKKVRSRRNLSELDSYEDHEPVVLTSKNTLDLHGIRVKEGLELVKAAIDARPSNSVLFIIHGLGTGVMKNNVLKLLKSHPRVAKFEQDCPTNYGRTVAYLK